MVEAHKMYSSIDDIRVQLGCIGTGCWGEGYLDNRRVVSLLDYLLFCMSSPRFRIIVVGSTGPIPLLTCSGG